MKSRTAVLSLICSMLMGQAFALFSDAPLPDQAQEQRARDLFYDIRCVVCQGESIAESPAQIAGDMRRAIRERVMAGDSDAAIKQMLAERYGDGILMKPPFKPVTYALWLGPAAFLIIAVFFAARILRRKP